jgi:hypothetical protein
MDPFLEGQKYWPGFHTKFINYAQEAISDRVPEAYEVLLEERLSLVVEPDEGPRRSAQPDLTVFRRPAPFGERAQGPAVLTIEPVLIPNRMEQVEEVREMRIEIRRRPGRELVTVVELLSPSNKEMPGEQLYWNKRLTLFDRHVHLVELDLLLGGHRLPTDAELPPGDYFAFVSRSHQRPMAEVYAWSIRDRLPLIPIPLLAPDPDVPLDLASVFATVYQKGRYERSIDHDAPLELPLSREDREWAEGVGKSTTR